MPTSISFTDAIGFATLTNQKPSPGDRFAMWTPQSVPYGESASRQSDGAITMMRFRDDYSVSFELPGIPSKAVAGVAMVDIADRLLYWLLLGGTCSVQTGDAVSSTYATCGLKPGTTPKLTLSDRENIEYTLQLELLNIAVSPVRMSCRYSDQ